jgi:GTP pyrophosphokinase
MGSPGNGWQQRPSCASRLSMPCTVKSRVLLPAGATPLDFAYHVHTEVGHRCRGAQVGGRIVPLDYRLHSGDRVEIMTAKTGEPRRDWLVAANGFLASARSREKVRNWFHRLDRARNVQAGRELLDRELKRVGLQHVDAAPALKHFNVKTIDDLQVLVALGDVGPHQVVRVLAEHERARDRDADGAVPAPGRPDRPKRPPPRRKQGGKGAPASVVGVGNVLVQLARCCQPLPGEPVSGYLTKGRGVSVHHAGCATLRRLLSAQPDRQLPVEWNAAQAGGHEVEAVIEAVDRKWLVKDLANVVAQEDAHLLDIHSESARNARVRLRVRLRVADHGQLSRLLAKLDALPGVEDARRA